MSKKSWALSLFFPALSIIAGSGILIFTIWDGVGFGAAAFTAILGLFCGGLLPAAIIIRHKVDVSKYFLGKVIMFAVLALLTAPSWIYMLFVWHGWGIFLLPVLIFIAEAVFAAVKGEDTKTKLCLVLSSLVHVYSGFLIDFARGFG